MIPFRNSRLRGWGGDDALSIPLVDIGAVIVIEETVCAHSAQVGADALTDFAFQLPEHDSFPLGRGLHDLCGDGVLVVVG